MNHGVDRRRQQFSFGRLTVLSGLAVLVFSCSHDRAGDPAVWSVFDTELRSEAEQFVALVTRVGCAGGATGQVLEPTISVGADSITILFQVEPMGDDRQLCPGNDPVPVRVDLGGPIGERSLLDGACLSTSSGPSIPSCANGGVRWSPPPPPVECDTPAAPARDRDIDVVPVPPVAAGTEGRAEFAAEILTALRPMVIGADADSVIETLREAGWIVTVVEQSTATTTITPDLLWSRLVVTVCDGRVDAISFD